MISVVHGEAMTYAYISHTYIQYSSIAETKLAIQLVWAFLLHTMK